ncbi:MAG: Lipoyl synthase, partial [uncultured Quadrisphaera sp.]
AARRGPQRRDPHRAQARVDPHPRDDGAGVHGPEEPGQARGPAHGVRGGRVPQHLRVLGGPRGHLPHRRRPVHPPLRLLPDRHGQARRLRRRRAAAGRGVGAGDGPALLHRHRRRARRPGGRRRVAVRRDRPADPRAEPRHRRRAADPRLRRGARAARRGLLLAPRGARPQRGDRPADLQADPPRVPVRAVAVGAHGRARRGAGHQVEPHPRHGRDHRRGDRGPPGAARRRHRPGHDHPVPAPQRPPPPRGAVGAPRGVRRAGRRGRGDGLP